MAPTPLEQALRLTLKTLVISAPWSLVLLALPRPEELGLLGVVTIHLSVVVIIGLLMVAVLLPLLDATWFSSSSPVRGRFATGAFAVALVTGTLALVTLPSSAALRFVPSLQFLQLISVLDIAWVTSATAIGVGWMVGRKAGLIAGWAMGAVCVWSLWSYLSTVGFAADGGWLVDQAALMRLVLPYDAVAAVVALVTLGLGARRKAGPSVR